MPNTAEQVAQIDASLRRQFLPYVPKVETERRRTWSENNHDDDRLSRALAAYSLVYAADADIVTACSAVIDGDNDGGLDAMYFDRAQNRLLLVQSKYKRNGAAPAQHENLKTINGIRMLLARRFDEFNNRVQLRRDEIEDALDTPGIVLELLHVYLGEVFSPHVTNDLDALAVELNGFSEQFRWRSIPLSRVYGWLLEEQAPAIACDEITLLCSAEITQPRKAVYGQIAACELAELVAKHGKALFERNIRHYLGSIGVNTAITQTVKRQPDDFFYLNNGITAVAEKIEPAAPAGGSRKYRLTNFSIVNGAQTAGAIAVAGDIPPNAKLLITVIEIGGSQDDLGLRITRARNHQNTVRGVDFAALDPNQERLRQELAVDGITYFYRPSAEARIRRDDACTLEEAAVALACMSHKVLTSAQALQPPRNKPNAVDFVITAKKEVGAYWEQDGAIYKQLFADGLSGRRLWRAVRIYRFVDSILSGYEGSQPANSMTRLFYRHSRYFVMAFIAHRAPDVVTRVETTISGDDKLILSRLTNELAELVYAVSVPLQGSKGYLAIFRNLTDAQPLADRVLAQLAAKDQAAVRLNSTTPDETPGAQQGPST